MPGSGLMGMLAQRPILVWHHKIWPMWIRPLSRFSKMNAWGLFLLRTEESKCKLVFKRFMYPSSLVTWTVDVGVWS